MVNEKYMNQLIAAVNGSMMIIKIFDNYGGKWSIISLAPAKEALIGIFEHALKDI